MWKRIQLHAPEETLCEFCPEAFIALMMGAVRNWIVGQLQSDYISEEGHFHTRRFQKLKSQKQSSNLAFSQTFGLNNYAKLSKHCRLYPRGQEIPARRLISQKTERTPELHTRTLRNGKYPDENVQINIKIVVLTLE
jgi:hypothetical protein